MVFSRSVFIYILNGNMNLPNDLLTGFVAISDRPGFTCAGEKWGHFQPAINLQIQRLQDMLETHLDERSSRELMLSLCGRHLTEDAGIIRPARRTKTSSLSICIRVVIKAFRSAVGLSLILTLNRSE